MDKSGIPTIGIDIEDGGDLIAEETALVASDTWYQIGVVIDHGNNQVDFYIQMQDAYSFSISTSSFLHEW